MDQDLNRPHTHAKHGGHWRRAAAAGCLVLLPAAAAPAAAQNAPASPGRDTALAARIIGSVYDSLGRRPLAGAVVQLVRAADLTAARSTTADSLGRFALDSVASGQYLVGFYHPLLELLEMEFPPRAVDVAPGAGEVRVDLATRAPAQVWAALCGRAPAPADSNGFLAGRVRDAETDVPVANASVVLTWSELTLDASGLRTERRRVPVTTGRSGSYLVCGVPAGGGVVASAAAPGRTSGLVEVEVPSRGLLVQDFALGDSAAVAAAGADSAAPPLARGTARLTGTVRGPDGRPLRGARAVVWGTAASAQTGDGGTFALDALPAGTRTLDVRAIGYEPRRVAVDLASGRAATADVRMSKAVPTLDRVTVVGRPSRRARLIDEFLERKRRNAFGRFITAADIERSSPLVVTDALRMTPGVRVVPAGGYGNAIVGRGNCTPGVVLDGMPITGGASEIDLLVSPQQIAGIEVYAGMAGAPPQYGGLLSNGCGVVLLWTKR